MTPVSVITGFLGSGKTTFIRRILHDPGFGRTAIIVNEFGEISLDHDLIASSDDTVLTLNTGCLCCAVQTDLARTLLELAQRRDRGDAVYDRVLIETSGLANPGPMVQAILTDREVVATHCFDSIVTIADALHGEATLAEHVEARAQVAVADVVLISKQDIQPLSERLNLQLRSLNPAASIIPVEQASAALLFGAGPADRSAVQLPSVPARHAEIDTFALVRDRPLPALALPLLLQALAEHCAPRLLRLKGLVALEEMPNQPAVIHGVHHVVSKPEFLPRWPSPDEMTRIVFIGKGIPRYFPHRLLAAIEEDVRDAMRPG